MACEIQTSLGSASLHVLTQDLIKANTFLQNTSKVSHGNESVRELYLMSLLIFSTSVAMNQLAPLLSRDEADSWSHTQHLIWAEERWAGCRAADSKEATVPGSVAPLQLEREELWAKLLGLYEHSPYKLKSSVVCPKVSWVYWSLYCLWEREEKKVLAFHLHINVNVNSLYILNRDPCYSGLPWGEVLQRSHGLAQAATQESFTAQPPMGLFYKEIIGSCERKWKYKREKGKFIHHSTMYAC